MCNNSVCVRRRLGGSLIKRRDKSQKRLLSNNACPLSFFLSVLPIMEQFNEIPLRHGINQFSNTVPHISWLFSVTRFLLLLKFYSIFLRLYWDWIDLVIKRQLEHFLIVYKWTFLYRGNRVADWGDQERTQSIRCFWLSLSMRKITSITVLFPCLTLFQEYSQNGIQQRRRIGRKLSQETGKKKHNQPFYVVWCDLVLIIRQQYSNFVSQAAGRLRTAVNGWVDLPKSFW